MIGDRKTDYIAAKINALDFVFVKKESEWKNGLKNSKKHKYQTIYDFNDLMYC